MSDITDNNGNKDTKRTLKKQLMLTCLGVFHLICLVMFVLAPSLWDRAERMQILDTEGIIIRGGDGPYGVVPLGLAAVLLANAFIAIGVTAPLSGRKPSSDWRSKRFLFLGLFVLFVIVSIFLPRAGSSWSDVTPLAETLRFADITNKDIIIGAACLVVALLLTRGWMRMGFLGWKPWAAVVLLVLAARYNRVLFNLPIYALMGLGCYVAYSALGRVWLWRSVVAAIVATIYPCFMVVNNFLYNVESDIPSFGSDIQILMWIRSYAGNLPDNSPWRTAQWLMSLPVIAAAAALTVRLRWQRALLWIIVLFEIFALLLTGKRMPMFGVMLMIPIGIILAARSKWKIVIPIAAALVLCVFVLDAVGILHLRQLFFSVDKVSERVDLYKLSLDMFLQHPILGAGFGQYFEYVTRYQPQLSFARYPHNDYLHLLCEGGIIGISLAAAAGFQLFLAGRRIISTENMRPIRALALAFGAQFISIAFTQSITGEQFIVPQWLYPNLAIFTGLLGAIWADTRGAQND